MVTVHYAALLAITLVISQSYCAAANFNIPVLSPLFGNACQENVCGRGNCVTSNSSNFGFECECEPGWKQARSEDDDNFKFLPCVIPNCTLNYTCATAAPPAPSNQNRHNLSFFDPCFWTDCGGGTCNKTSVFTHACVCEEGYYNLFNATAFPCYHQCAFEGECAHLGLNFTNTTTSHQGSSPSNANDSNSHTRLIPRVEWAWLVTMLTTLALLFCKHT